MASNVYPWQHACRETGASLSIVPFPAVGSSWISSILDRLDASVAVVAVGATHWCDGSLIDISTLSVEISKRYSPDMRPYFLIDGTQSIGAMHFDVMAVKPDMVSCSVHKWLLAGRGLALVYLNPAHHGKWLPLDHHDRTREGSQYSFWDNIGTMHWASDEPNAGQVGYPEKFLGGALSIEAGGGHNFVQMAMLQESLTLLNDCWRPERIYPYLSYLTDNFANKLTAAFPDGPVAVLPKEERSGNILGIRVCADAPWSITPARIVEDLLRSHNIIVAERAGVIRVSPFISHTVGDMDRAVASFVDVINSMQERPRVMITGGTGWLAQHLYKAMCPELDGAFMSTRSDVHVTYQQTSVRPHWVPKDRTHKMNLSGVDSNVDDVIRRVAPQYIIHCAAVSSIAVCEKDPVAVDANAPTQLLEAINKYVPDAIVVFTSTDIVYAGRDDSYSALSPHDEYMVRNPPLCEYGRNKLTFERLLISSVKNHVILRLSNSLGALSPFRPAGIKFLEFLENAAFERKSIDLKNDEYRSFVDVRDVVRIILKIVGSSASDPLIGAVYNVGGPKGMNRVDLAIAVAHGRGIPIQIFDAREKIIYSTVGQFESSERSWDIHSVSFSEFLIRNPPVGTVVTVPQRVIMDSSHTEAAFGVKFTTVEDLVRETCIV